MAHAPARDNWTTPSVEEGVRADDRGASGRSRTRVAKAASISRLGAGVENCDLQPDGASSRLHVSFDVDSVFAGLAGLTSDRNTSAAGTNSRSSSSCFAASSRLKKLIPVRLPPGRARLATRPSLTGSSPLTKTMGIVVVAALAANDRRSRRSRRSRRPAGGPDRPPAPAVDRFDFRPSGIRSPRSGPRHSRRLSDPGEMPRKRSAHRLRRSGC